MNTSRKVVNKNFRVSFHNLHVEQETHFLFIFAQITVLFLFLLFMMRKIYNDINFLLQVLLFGMIFVAMVFMKAQV